MPIYALYAVVVLIWGSTWFAIKFQLGEVAEEWSVAYRFAIASACLFGYARLKGDRLTLPRSDYWPIVVMGALMFSISYVLVYFGSNHITTGLVAVLFSLIVICNGVLERFFYGTPLDSRLVLASIVGLSGMAFVFWPELSDAELGDGALTGILLTLAAVVAAALGNMAAIRNTRHGWSVVVINAHGMAWGANLSAIIAIALDRPLNFSLSTSYVTSLLFLAIFGSSIAFGCFLVLLKTLGAARSSYVSVIFPIVALLISTLFEDYRWTAIAAAGVVLIVAGNWLALTRTPVRSDGDTDNNNQS